MYYDNKSQLPHSVDSHRPPPKMNKEVLGVGTQGGITSTQGLGWLIPWNKVRGGNNIGGMDPKNIWRCMLLVMSLRCTPQAWKYKTPDSESRALNHLITPSWEINEGMAFEGLPRLGFYRDFSIKVLRSDFFFPSQPCHQFHRPITGTRTNLCLVGGLWHHWSSYPILSAPPSQQLSHRHNIQLRSQNSFHLCSAPPPPPRVPRGSFCLFIQAWFHQGNLSLLHDHSLCPVYIIHSHRPGEASTGTWSNCFCASYLQNCPPTTLWAPWGQRLCLYVQCCIPGIQSRV